MSLLVESIKIHCRTAWNLPLHAARMNRSRQQLFKCQEPIDLQKVLNIPDNLTDGVYKCRIIYDTSVRRIEYLPYVPKSIASLQLLEGTLMEYGHKYEDRSQIDALKSQSTADDIIIVKEGRLTDASSANVVLFDGRIWRTPVSPLLHGTKRQLLLDEGRIMEEDILAKDIRAFQKVALINALRDLDEHTAVNIRNVF
jgi:4-amino-4-deoxychorismate lyase